jgi:hypothetical protein
MRGELTSVCRNKVRAWLADRFASEGKPCDMDKSQLRGKACIPDGYQLLQDSTVDQLLASVEGYCTQDVSSRGVDRHRPCIHVASRLHTFTHLRLRSGKLL